MAQAQPPLTAGEVSALFPAATPPSNIARYWPHISSALAEEGLGDRAMALLALATIRAESEGFEPIDEHPSVWNTAPGGHPYGLYDERRDLGNLGIGDGEAFRGRGFVQLTGRENYARYGEQIGVDLLERPELANDPEVAAHLLARFLKEREAPLRQALAHDDLAASTDSSASATPFAAASRPAWPAPAVPAIPEPSPDCLSRCWIASKPRALWSPLSTL